jgi:hypothetical protein
MVYPSGKPSSALSVSGGGDLGRRGAVFGVYAPAAGAWVVGRMGHLFAASWWAMPPVLNTCSRATFQH